MEDTSTQYSRWSLVTETELGINQIKIDISYPTVPSMKNSLFVSLDASPDQDYYFVLCKYGGISGQLLIQTQIQWNRSFKQINRIGIPFDCRYSQQKPNNS